MLGESQGSSNGSQKWDLGENLSDNALRWDQRDLTPGLGFQVSIRENSSIRSSGSDSDLGLWLLSPQMSAQPDGINGL